MAAAELERYRAETDAITAHNEIARMLARRADRERKRDTEVSARERETERKTNRNLRYMFAAVTVVGVIVTAVLTGLAVSHREPVFLTGSGAGLLLSGGGIFELQRLGRARRSPDV